jgi:hypothetical protein
MKKLVLLLVAFICTTVVSSGYIIYEKSTTSYIRQRMFMISSEKGLCSAVQVIDSKGNIVLLSAAHCAGLLQGGLAITTSETGRRSVSRLIKIDTNADLMIMTAITEDYINIASHSKIHEHVRAVTHGSGMASYQTEGELLEIMPIQIAKGEIQSDKDRETCLQDPRDTIVDTLIGQMCMVSLPARVSTVKVVPGSSGGPVLNDSGELLGIVTACDSNEFSYFVTLKDIRKFLGYVNRR